MMKPLSQKNTGHDGTASHPPAVPVPGASSLPVRTLMERLEPYRYVIALVAVIVATVFRMALSPLVGLAGIPFLTYHPAVVVSAWFGGLKTGLFSVALGALTSSLFFVATPFSLHITDPQDQWSIILFIATGVGISYLGESQKRAYRAARESARQAATLAETMAITLRGIGDAVLSTDGEGRILFMNAVAARLTGWTEAEAVGRYSREVFCIVNEQTRREVESPVECVLRDGRIVGLANHTLLIARDGTERPIDDSGAPLRDAAGRLIGVVLVFRDITERRRAEIAQQELLQRLNQERARIDSLVASVPGVVWEAWGEPDQAAQRINYVSEYAETLLGYTREEWLATPNFWLAIVHPEDREQAARTASEAYARGGEHTNAFRWIGRDGRVFWVEAHSTVIRDAAGRHVGMRGVTIDITERVRAQEERERLLSEIQALNERLKRAMSETHHRVKNNLQVISALVNMQEMMHPDNVPTKELNRLNQHIRALATIHDLLTQQIRSDVLSDEISVQSAFERLMPMIQGLVEGRAIRFAVEDTRLPIRQGTSLAVLVNELVSNAIKHGDGDIDISFAVVTGRGRLEVRDRGDGFPPDFDPGTSAHTGLELIESLSRWDLRGSPSYVNCPEGGAQVIVEFPLPSTPAGQP